MSTTDIEVTFDIATPELEAEFELSAEAEIEATFQIDAQAGLLRQLQDVNISNVTDGQHLVYNATTEKWENRTAFFVYEQLEESTEWIITHNLGKFPSVTIVDTDGVRVEAEVTYVSENVCTISANIPFAGRAFLN